VYDRGYNRTNLTWSADEDQLAYQEDHFVTFRAPCQAGEHPGAGPGYSCSVMADDQQFVVPDLVFQAIYHEAGQLDFCQLASPGGHSLAADAWRAGGCVAAGSLLQRSLVDIFYTLPVIRSGVFDRHKLQEQVFFTRRTARELAFGYEDETLTELVRCDADAMRLDERLCGLLSGGKENCTVYLPKCRASGVHQELCNDVEDLQQIMEVLRTECPFQKVAPVRFKALGLLNTSVVNGNAVDRTNVVKTGKVSKEDAFQLKKRFGMSPVVLCPNEQGLPGDPCPDLSYPIQPYKDHNASLASGSYGERFQLQGTGRQRVPLWVDRLTRSVQLEKTNTKCTCHGVGTDRWELGRSELLNSSINGENDRYFQYGPSGFFNYSMANHRIPTFYSQPHFYGVDDKEVVDNVIGLSDPDPDAHSFYAEIEPITGMAMSYAYRLQMNVAPRSIQAGSLTKFFYHTETLFAPLDNYGGKLYVPVAWVDDGHGGSAAAASAWKGSLGVILVGKKWSEVAFAGIGALLMILGIIFWGSANWKRSPRVAGSDLDSNPLMVPAGLLAPVVARFRE